jgi:Arc-like DNA binding domain
LSQANFLFDESIWITVVHVIQIAYSNLERNAFVIHCAIVSRIDPQLKIRLPRPLKVKVEASARANGRSLNAEIVHLIQRAMSEAPDTIPWTAADFRARLDELTAEVTKLKKRVGSPK